MFDIAGQISWYKTINDGDYTPFKDIRFYDNIKCVKKTFSGDGFKFECLFKDAEQSSFYVDDSMHAYLYGYCFTKFTSDVSFEKGKLDAGRIAQLYTERSEGFIDCLKGSFSVIINDLRSKRLLIYTDPFNLRTIYYTFRDQQLFFSSSLNALIQIFRNKGWKTELDCLTLAQYYLFDYTLNEDTFIKDIKTVPPGCYLSYHNDSVSIGEYWNVFQHYTNLSPECSDKDGVRQIEEVMYKNIELYKGSPEETAVALTGGYDSRTLVSLLRQSTNDYEYYSYGKSKESWDLKVPQIIAKKLNLKYTTFYLDDKFSRDFNDNASIAIILGDGIAESSRSNYPFVYKNFLKNKKNILTGLFGSELIKAPTSEGSFWDKNTKALLQSDNVEAALDRIIDEGIENNLLMRPILQDNRKQLLEIALSLPYFNSTRPVKEKYFYFLLMIGIRKYFMKEIKVERPFVTNYHPYYDIEFIDVLMKTPFPWLYNWEEKKDLVKSLKMHRLYGYLIQRNSPVLANIISTHAYKPKYLMSNIYLPMLAAEYFYYKGRIDSSSGLNFDELIFKFGNSYFDDVHMYDKVFNNKGVFERKETDVKNFNKLMSLQVWMHLNGVSLD